MWHYKQVQDRLLVVSLLVLPLSSFLSDDSGNTFCQRGKHVTDFLALHGLFLPRSGLSVSHLEPPCCNPFPSCPPASASAAPSCRPPSSADSDTSGTPLADRRRRDLSSTPSPCSSPELRHSATAVSSHPRGAVGREKPPIPPRNSSVRLSADVTDGGSVKSKIQMFQQSGAPPPPSHTGPVMAGSAVHVGTGPPSWSFSGCHGRL